MEERSFYTSALKSGKGIQVNIARSTVKALSIEPQDELEITVRKTGRKTERKRNVKFPAPPQEKATTASFSGTQSSYVTKVDEGLNELAAKIIFRYNARDNDQELSDLIAVAANETDYSEGEIKSHPDVKKALEAK